MAVAGTATYADAEPLVPLTLEHFEAFSSNLTLPPKATDKGMRTRRRRASKTGPVATGVREPRGAPPRPIPLVIEPFQSTALSDLFDGVAETFVMLPKGNAKSMLAAVLALYHLCYVDEAEAFIFAASRDQASRLLNYAAGLVRRSSVLQAHLVLRLGFREIRARRDGGSLKVLAADPATADGIGPTLVICDELHRWKTLEPYTLAKEGLGKRDGQLLGISTAGEDENDAFGRMRKAALKHLSFTDGAYKYAPAPNDEFVWHEWSLEATDDLTDFELVKRANPLAQITVEGLRARYESPGTRRAWWARFVCGIWTRDDDAAIAAMDWAPCQVDHCEIPDGAEGVVIGADIAWRKDSTAIVPTWLVNSDPLVVRIDRRLQILLPPTDGTSLPVDDVWAVFEDYAARWPDATVAMDPNAGAELLAQRIEAELGLTVVFHAQDASPMAAATATFMELVREQRLEHPGHVEFSSHVLAAYLKSVGGERHRFVKGPGGSLIDGVIAACIAVRQLVALAEDDGPVMPYID